MGFHRLFGLASQSRRGGIGLEATFPSARARNAAGHDDHVADFRAFTLVSGIELAIHVDAAANAGPKGQKNSVLVGFVLPEFDFAKHRGVRVVVDFARKQKLIREDFRDREVFPSKVARVIADSGEGIDASRDAAANRDGAVAFLNALEGVFRRGNETTQGAFLLFAGDDGHHEAGKEMALAIHQGALHRRSADIDSQNEFTHSPLNYQSLALK